MATGIIGALNGAGTLTYTATKPTKVNIICGGTSTVSLNGVHIYNGGNAGTDWGASNTIWVGTGQTITLVVAANASIFLSCLEGE